MDVIDAISRAYDTDYATVHRGIYQRSSDMTGRYEAARSAAAMLIGGHAGDYRPADSRITGLPR